MPRKTHIIKNLSPVHKVWQGGPDKSKLEGWLDRVQEGNSEIKLNYQLTTFCSQEAQRNLLPEKT